MTIAGPPPTRERLVDMLRAGAHGEYPDEAAVELLIAHRTLLGKDEIVTDYVICEDPGDPEACAWVDYDRLTYALDDGRLPYSSTEKGILRIAASLAGGFMVDLQDALTGLDNYNSGIVVEALLHATGATGRYGATVNVPEPPKYPPGVHVVDRAGNVLQQGDPSEGTLTAYGRTADGASITVGE